jgi:co-chaperonin GroES (HSP10)|tara:strand:+ start:2292 stop:2558 length:267 start_codon:yes stop_codon:yes gene_type:complete
MIKAIKNRIFIKKDELPEKIGNIYVPKSEGQYAPPYSGTILSVGGDIEDEDIKVGSRILFHDLAGTEFKYNSETIFSIRENDVTAIIL